MMDRRQFLIAGVSLASARHAGLGASFSPDGTIIVGQPGGGGNGTLRTAYGSVTFGSFQAPHDGTNAGSFCMPTLNGVQMNPAGVCGAFGIPALMQLWMDFGNRIYGIGNDQIWLQWAGYRWVPNYGADLASGPSATDPVPAAPLPTYAPPYTPSSENSSISGGSGSLQTADGVWTFGAVGGGGYRGRLNGIDLLDSGGGYRFYDQMTVYGHSQMFLHRSDTPGWEYWALNQQNPSTGPTSAGVPVNLTISPSRPTVPSGSSPGVLVANIATVMSDASIFSGTLALSDMTYFVISGSTIVVNSTPPINFYPLVLSAAQNGATLNTYILIGVS